MRFSLWFYLRFSLSFSSITILSPSSFSFFLSYYFSPFFHGQISSAGRRKKENPKAKKLSFVRGEKWSSSLPVSLPHVSFLLLLLLGPSSLLRRLPGIKTTNTHFHFPLFLLNFEDQGGNGKSN